MVVRLERLGRKQRGLEKRIGEKSCGALIEKDYCAVRICCG